LDKLPCLKSKLAKPVDNIENSDLETILAKQSNDQLPNFLLASLSEQHLVKVSE
jgi:hypothetical protein